MKTTLVGIDIAKQKFHVYSTDAKGHCVEKKELTRKKLLGYTAQLPACTVVMEACGSANYWARQIKKQGHEVKLISPQFVKPFVKTNKNDYNDAQAITEAASRPSMRYVSIKTVEQQDIQSIHRIRSRLVHDRTALANQIRGLLAEYGISIAQGISQVRRALPLILEDAENELTGLTRELLADLQEEMVALDKRIKAYDIRIEHVFKTNPECQRIGAIEGIGPIAATALVAAIGNVHEFKNGRHLSAWLGLVPKQHSSGGKSTLLGISKRGDTYLRTLLIHGARTVIKHSARKTDRRSQWIQAKQARSGVNKTSVALANKNARVIWALLAHEEAYKKAA